jgi:hypothetical protein
MRIGERRPNRPHEPLSVAERYPEFFEIALGQLGQHVAVDRIRDERGLVLLESMAPQPVANVHAVS